MYVKEYFERVYQEVYRKACEEMCENFPTIKYGIENNFAGVKVRTGYNYLFSKGKTEKSLKIIGTLSELSWLCAINLDDITDGDTVRYSKPATHTVFGPYQVKDEAERFHNTASEELSGDSRKNFLLQWELEKKSFELEKRNTNNRKLTLKEFLEINISKTACGIFSAYQTQKLVNPSLSRDIEKYAIFMAVAGQIKNDILDFGIKGYEEYAKFSDLKNGYVTYPLLLLKERDAERFETIMETKDINLCKKIFENYSILIQALSDAAFLSEKAKEYISSKEYISWMENSEARKILGRWCEEHKRFRRARFTLLPPSEIVGKISEKIEKITIFG